MAVYRNNARQGISAHRHSHAVSKGGTVSGVCVFVLMGCDRRNFKESFLSLKSVEKAMSVYVHLLCAYKSKSQYKYGTPEISLEPNTHIFFHKYTKQ
jgi:hypothetical protein